MANRDELWNFVAGFLPTETAETATVHHQAAALEVALGVPSTAQAARPFWFVPDAQNSEPPPPPWVNRPYAEAADDVGNWFQDLYRDWSRPPEQPGDNGGGAQEHQAGPAQDGDGRTEG